MRRIKYVVLAGVGAVALASGSAHAARPSTCAQLRGPNQVKSTAIKVVARHVAIKHHFTGTRYYGCVVGAGHVRFLGERGIDDSLTFSDRFVKFADTAGTYLVVKRTYDTEANPGPEYDSIVDLRTGRERLFASDVLSACNLDPTAPAARTALAADGTFVALFADVIAPEKSGCSGYRNHGQALLRATTRSGATQVLDLAPQADIPPTSVSVQGSTASWTRAGVAQQAQIASFGPPPTHELRAPRDRSCRHFTGAPVAHAGALRVVRVRGRAGSAAYEACYGRLRRPRTLATTGRVTVDAARGSVLAYTVTTPSRVTKYVLDVDRADEFFAYWDRDLTVDCTRGPQAATPPPAKIALSSEGVLGVVFADAGGADADCYPNRGQAIVESSFGLPSTFDLAPATAIAPASLAFDATKLVWSDGGVTRSEDTF